MTSAARSALEEGGEGGAGDEERVDRLESDYRRRTRLVVDRRELAEQIAGAANGDDHLTAGRAERHDVDAARQENDNGSRVVALVKERDAGAVPARPADGPQILGLDI